MSSYGQIHCFIIGIPDASKLLSHQQLVKKKWGKNSTGSFAIKSFLSYGKCNGDCLVVVLHCQMFLILLEMQWRLFGWGVTLSNVSYLIGNAMKIVSLGFYIVKYRGPSI